MTDTETLGGAEGYLRTLLTNAPSDFEIALALPMRPATSPLIAEARSHGIDVYPVESVRGRGLNAPGFIRSLRLLRSLRPDVVHFTLGSPRRSAEAIVAARVCRVPRRIATFQLVTQPDDGSWPKSALIRAQRRLRFGALSVAIAVSKGNQELLAEGHQVPRRRIVVVPNCVDTLRFRPGDDDGALRTLWGIPTDAPLLGVIGRLTAQKGHAVLLEAMPTVWRRHPSTHLLLVGSGELEEDLRRQASEVGGDGRIVFAGHSDEPEKALAAIDLAVLPSLFEGMSFSLLEALAAGTPVVASAVDGTTEALEGETAGLLVPPGESASLADAILRLLDDAEGRSSMAAAARERAIEAYGQDSMLQRTFSLYGR